MWERARVSVRDMWLGFWFPQGPPHALALSRVLIGAFLLIYWLRHIAYVRILFSSDGLCFPLIASPGEFDQIRSFSDFIGWLVAEPSLVRAWTLYLLTVLTAVGFTFGLFFRVSAVLHLLLWAYHWVIYIAAADYSYDRDFYLMVVFLTLSPCAQVLSLDALRRRKSGLSLPSTIELWAQRVICVHLSITYFGAGVSKVLAPAWRDGNVLLGIWSSDWGTPLAGTLLNLGLPLWFWTIAPKGVILFQLGVGFIMFSKRWIGPALLGATVFHVCNALTMGLWEFLYLPLLYPLFLDPGAVANWISARTGGEKKPFEELGPRWWFLQVRSSP